MPKVGIQAWRSTNWNAGAGAEASKPAHSASDSRNVTSDTPSAAQRTVASLAPSRLGSASSSSAPASGSATSSVRIGTPVTSHLHR